ncbi:MAG TPA: TonB-dependent receptor [Myxococcales bacterium]|nr:TonB-dependent receptor [Myxococcales bacterium]
MIATCLSLLLAAAAAPGEAQPDTSDLEGLLDSTVISGASSNQEAASDAPATVTVVTAEQMRRLGLRSVDEAINFLSLGMAVQNPLHSVELGARGVLLSGDYGNHVLVRVDGHAMNEQWDGTAYFEQGLALPIEAIDHVEIILGPGSVLYGGNPMLGIINIVTRKASEKPGLMLVSEGGLSPRQNFEGSIDSSGFTHPGGSYRLGAGWAGEFSLFGQQASLVAHAEYYAQNGPTFLFGPQTGTDGLVHDFGPLSQSATMWGGRAGYYTQVPALYARLEAGDLSLALHLAQYERSTPYMDLWSNTTTDFNDPNSFERDQWLQLDARWSRQIDRQLALTAHLYGDAYEWDNREVSSDPAYCVPGVARCLSGTPAHARWAGLELQGSWDWTGSGATTTLIGAEGRLRRIWDHVLFQDAATGADLGSIDNPVHDEHVGSLYLQQRLSPLPFLHFNAGARFDSDSRGGENLSPRAAVVADLWKDATAKVIYSTGYRVPTVYEAYSDGEGQVANPALQPERVQSVELSLEQRHGRTHVMLGAFRSWWTDMIALIQLPDGSTQYQNRGDIDNYGLEAAAQAAFEPFTLGMTITAAHTQEAGRDLSVAPQVFGNAYVTYALAGAHTASFAVSAVGSRPADRAFDGNFPVTPTAPASAELRLAFAGPLLRGVDYRAGIDFNTGRTVPYVAGPNQFEDPSAALRPAAELAPTVRLTAFAGLQWRLAP